MTGSQCTRTVFFFFSIAVPFCVCVATGASSFTEFVIWLSPLLRLSVYRICAGWGATSGTSIIFRCPLLRLSVKRVSDDFSLPSASSFCEIGLRGFWSLASFFTLGEYCYDCKVIRS